MTTWEKYMRDQDAQHEPSDDDLEFSYIVDGRPATVWFIYDKIDAHMVAPIPQAEQTAHQFEDSVECRHTGHMQAHQWNSGAGPTEHIYPVCQPKDKE